MHDHRQFPGHGDHKHTPRPWIAATGARAAIVELRDAIVHEPGHDWPPMRLERIETVPVTRDAFLALLDDGVGAIIKSYDIIETIGEE